MPPARTIAFYTRVSTDQQANADAGSLDTQEARLAAYLVANGEESAPYRVFRGEGESAKSLERPALHTLMTAIKAGTVSRVMVTRVDRLSRSLLDFYRLTELFKEHDVAFVSVTERFDTTNAMGRAMLNLLLVFAQLERETTGERTKAAIKSRAERGLWNGGPRPLGYDPVAGGHLQVVPSEAELVVLMFHKYVELRSAPRLAGWLNDQGHRQKEYSSRRRGAVGGRPFAPHSVRQILTNRIYLGEVSLGEVSYPAKHAPIVDVELFDRVQAVIATNEKHKGSGIQRARYDYLLTGLLRCACGGAATPSAGNGKGGRYHYYRCVGLGTKDRHHCDVKQMRAERVDEAVLAIVREAANEPARLAEAVLEANRMAKEMVSPMRVRVDQLRKELTAAQREAEELVGKALAAGIAATTTVRQMLDAVEERQRQVRTALSAAEGELAARETDQLDLEVVVQAIRGFNTAWEHLTLVEKRELLGLMVEEVVLVGPDQIEVAMHEGRRVNAWLAAGGHVPTVPGDVPGRAGHRERGGNSGGDPAIHQGFAESDGWLPLPDLNRGPSD